MSEAAKKRFFSYFKKLNSNMKPYVSFKKISEIFKSTRVIKKNLFLNKC